MSATVDLPALTIETPVAHLTSPRTPVKASSKSSHSPQAGDTRPTCPTFRFGLISENGKRFGYSTMNAGFQVSEYLADQELRSPGCFQNGSAVSSALNLFISEDKTESKEHSTLLQPLDEEKHELPRDKCVPVNIAGMSGVLNNDSRTSVVSSRLLVQHLTQSSGLINNSTKNGNSYSPAGNGDCEENGRQHEHENALEITTDDHNVEWSDNDEDEIECGDCSKVFCNIQSYMDHTCCRISEGSKTPVVDEALRCYPALCSFNTGLPNNEAVRFLGKIIFTQNGSAYVIEDTAIDRSALTELGNSIVPNEDGSGVLADACLPQLSSVVLFPKMNSSLITSPGQNAPLQQEGAISNHLFYSYHVFDIATMRTKEILQLLSPAQDGQQRPKPVVMCFICRLIFRKTESFFRHAACAHSVDVAEEKRSLLCRFNNSVVCHTGGNDKQPKFSMLLPMLNSCIEPRCQNSASISCRRKLADFVTSRRSSDCERRMFLCDNMENSYTYPNKVCKTLEDAMLQAHFMPNCEWNSSLDAANTSSSQFAGKRKITNENSIRVSSPAPSIMTGWYSLPSNDSSDNCILTDSGTITSSATQTAVTCCSLSPVTKVSVPPSSICSLSTPPVTSINSVMVNNQNDVFSTATTLSTSNCLNLSGFSCTCEQHSQARTNTEECPKDTGLDSALYLVHNSALNHSRNSCKTLKCPKCNWHYKYQETLDIHMKEKHPDNDAQCVYCLTTQTHPRLTRGESYACGYKPYRCEVCNYSTTTKGNLSIHMQSDKHINNMQDLASGSPGRKMPSQHPHSNQPPAVTSPASLHTSSTSLSPNETLFKRFKQKQSFRCDICNYETSLGRNLRIHITSEKHAHNLFVLSQSFSHLSQDAALDQVNTMLTIYNHEQSGHLSAFRQHLPNSLFHNDNGNLLVPGTADCSLVSQETTPNVSQENGVDQSNKPSSNKEPDVVFKCCMCNRYGSDKLEDVHSHIQQDRNTIGSSEFHMSTTDGDYYCNLCSYKTHLKANFHLHCKTDKHLYKLQAYNHILEGGPSNEWKLSCPDFPWQICCNPCRFYANSTHNMQIHVNNSEHEARCNIFGHLQVLEREAPEPAVGSLRYYHCSLCRVNVLTKAQFVAHARTPQHVGKEELGTPHQALNFEVFLLKELPAGEDVDFLNEGE